MAINLTAALKRVPRWAWYTSAGVGIGAVALYTFRNRGEAEEEEPTDTAAGYPDTFAPSPVPGIVVPDINIPASNAGESGYLDLHMAYLAGLETLFNTLRDRPIIEPSPAAPIPVQVTLAPTGGGAPSQPRTGVVTAPPPPAQKPPAPKPPAPKPCCTYGGHPLSWWRNSARKNKNGWLWPDGNRHSRRFEGNRACDGGGVAGGSKREC